MRFCPAFPGKTLREVKINYKSALRKRSYALCVIPSVVIFCKALFTCSIGCWADTALLQLLCSQISNGTSEQNHNKTDGMTQTVYYCLKRSFHEICIRALAINGVAHIILPHPSVPPALPLITALALVLAFDRERALVRVGRGTGAGVPSYSSLCS